MSLFKEFAKRMPTVEEIAEIAARKLASRQGGSAETLRRNFSALTLEIEKVGYDIFLKKQSEVGEEVLSKFLKTHTGQPVFQELNSFFLSLTQSRRTRAGKTFEETIKACLDDAATLNAKCNQGCCQRREARLVGMGGMRGA